MQVVEDKTFGLKVSAFERRVTQQRRRRHWNPSFPGQLLKHPACPAAAPPQNKNKSKKVQNYVNQLQKSAQPQKNPRLEEPSRKVRYRPLPLPPSFSAIITLSHHISFLPAQQDKKKLEEEKQKELNALFAMAIKQPKVPVGVDPKSVVCEFFRHGQCTKGFKCKFSHDLSVERKGPKLDLYSDM